MGAQPRGTTPVKVNAITTAKKLSQQARMTQQVRAATQSVSKNITVVSLKRRSTDNSGSGEPPKVARTTEPSIASELCDEELQQGLEEQKRLREMIKKRKEEARRRQAELRRRELEARLAKQGLTIEDVEQVGTKPSAETQPEHNPAAEDAGSVQQGAQRIMTVVSRGGKKQLTTPAKQQQQQQQQQQQPVTAQHPVQPQLASQPPQQFAGQHYQQQSAVFSSLPPQQQQQQQHQHNPGVFNNPGFAQQQQQQQFQPPQQPVRQQQQLPQQTSPAPLGQSPFKSQPFQQTQQPPPAAPQQFQSPPPGGQFAQAARSQFPPQQFEFQQPQSQPQQQRFLPHESGDAPGTAQRGRQQFQNRQAILGAVVGRGAARGMASGQVASVRGQDPTGRGQGAGGRGQVVRGRGQVGRGGGQLSRGRGMTVGMAASPQRTMSASSGPQASSNRVVIPVGRGRGIPQGAASAPPSGRMVVQRQVVPRSASTKSKMVTSGATQKVSIDNLAKGTQEFEIRQHCESVGPVLDIVMIESQQKAIVTFGSKAHAVQFAKQWNRRMVNLSLMSVTLLP